ncbi:unnamed protein product [Caenorhabditis auriculariae]|uniref:Uncharacterized protein n=1 Tax=Caenorhabditis auriculariae TaxID=2777116 RepID=A0A8S1GYY8_9PELO|nr:unnamed protein product [Caenorhabditis auriculariae]
MGSWRRLPTIMKHKSQASPTSSGRVDGGNSDAVAVDVCATSSVYGDQASQPTHTYTLIPASDLCRAATVSSAPFLALLFTLTTEPPAVSTRIHHSYTLGHRSSATMSQGFSSMDEAPSRDFTESRKAERDSKTILQKVSLLGVILNMRSMGVRRQN